MVPSSWILIWQKAVFNLVWTNIEIKFTYHSCTEYSHVSSNYTKIENKGNKMIDRYLFNVNSIAWGPRCSSVLVFCVLFCLSFFFVLHSKVRVSLDCPLLIASSICTKLRYWQKHMKFWKTKELLCKRIVLILTNT